MGCCVSAGVVCDEDPVRSVVERRILGDGPEPCSMGLREADGHDGAPFLSPLDGAVPAGQQHDQHYDHQWNPHQQHRQLQRSHTATPSQLKESSLGMRTDTHDRLERSELAPIDSNSRNRLGPSNDLAPNQDHPLLFVPAGADDDDMPSSPVVLRGDDMPSGGGVDVLVSSDGSALSSISEEAGGGADVSEAFRRAWLENPDCVSASAQEHHFLQAAIINAPSKPSASDPVVDSSVRSSCCLPAVTDRSGGTPSGPSQGETFSPPSLTMDPLILDDLRRTFETDLRSPRGNAWAEHRGNITYYPSPTMKSPRRAPTFSSPTTTSSSSAWNNSSNGGAAGAGPLSNRTLAGKFCFTFNDCPIVVDELDLALPALAPTPSSSSLGTRGGSAAPGVTSPMILGASRIPPPRHEDAKNTSPSTSIIAKNAKSAFKSQAVENDEAALEMNSSAEAAGCDILGLDVTATVAGFPGTRKPNAAASKFHSICSYEVRTILGHAAGRVKCIAVGVGEKECAISATDDLGLACQDVRSGYDLGAFRGGHTEPIISAAYSRCGSYLATAGRDYVLVLWDVVTQSPVVRFQHPTVVICCDFSADGKYLVTGSQDKVCRIWDVQDRGALDQPGIPCSSRPLGVFDGHTAMVITARFAPCGRYVCSAGADRKVLVWSLSRGRVKFALSGHRRVVICCQYSNCGRTIISNDEETLRFWSARDGNEIKVVRVGDIANRYLGGSYRSVVARKVLVWTISCAAPGRFTKYAVAATNHGFVFIVDIATGLEVLHVVARAPVYCLTAGTNRLVAFGDANGNVYMLSLGAREYAWTKEEKAAYASSTPRLVLH